MITSNSTVLYEFLKRDINKLIDYYNSIDTKVVEKVELLFEAFQEQHMEELLKNDFNNIVDLSSQLDEQEARTDVMRLYFNLSDYVKEITFQEVQQVYEEIESSGYYLINEYLIYKSLGDIESYARERVQDMVRNSYELSRVFDKDTLAYYVASQVPLYEIEEEILNNVNDYEELLELDPEVMFEGETGDCYYIT